MAQIDTFRARLQQGGARPSQFRIIMSTPSGLPGFSPDIQAQSSVEFLGSAAAIPASRITPIPVFYRGRQTKVAGEREFDNWTITVINDGDFGIRNMLETWSTAVINHARTNGELFSLNYQVPLQVQQLDRNDQVLKQYTFHNCFPLNVGEIGLDFQANTTIETFQVEFSVDYWTAQNVNTTDQA